MFFYVNAIDVLDPIRLKELGGCDVVDGLSFLFNNYDSLVILRLLDSQITRLR